MSDVFWEGCPPPPPPALCSHSRPPLCYHVNVNGDAPLYISNNFGALSEYICVHAACMVRCSTAAFKIVKVVQRDSKRGRMSQFCYLRFAMVHSLAWLWDQEALASGSSIRDSPPRLMAGPGTARCCGGPLPSSCPAPASGWLRGSATRHQHAPPLPAAASASPDPAGPGVAWLPSHGLPQELPSAPPPPRSWPLPCCPRSPCHARCRRGTWRHGRSRYPRLSCPIPRTCFVRSHTPGVSG